MFRKIYLKNYKSFKEVDVDFTKADKPLNLVFIYGENGSGKSNIISAFLFLKNTLSTLNFQNMLNKIMHDDELKEKIDDVDSIIKIISKRHKSLVSLAESSKMIDSNDDMILKYDLDVNDRKAIYELRFDKNHFLVSETMHYQLNKAMVKILEFNRDQHYINPKIILENDYRKEIMKTAEQYWGKHTFLSICQNEIISKEGSYIKNVFNQNFLELQLFISNYSVSAYSGFNKIEGEYGINSNILSQIEGGIINYDNEEELDKVEEALRTFLMSTYSDIKNVKYKKVIEDSKIQYELMIYKLIGNQVKEIPFELESTGTQRLINTFTSLYLSSIGSTVFIDEVDSGIHDILMLNIIKSLNEINGQLILTTHNTLLLEEINPNSTFIIRIDSEGNKVIQSISKISGTQKNHNNRVRYLDGLFDGVPYNIEFDFTEIAEELKEYIK